jgi:hypothetical protein
MADIVVKQTSGLPDAGFLVRINGAPALILVHDELSDVEARCVVAHERRHAEDDWCTSILPERYWERHEERVDRDAAIRLVASTLLRRWIDALGDAVATIEDVAVEFGVTPRYAALALAQARIIDWSDVPPRTTWRPPSQ